MMPCVVGFYRRSTRRGGAVGVLISALMIVVIVAAVRLSAREEEDPLFRGVAESIWIKDLAPGSDESQLEEWRGFGEAGIRVLVRGFELATDRTGRLHRQVHQKLPR